MSIYPDLAIINQNLRSQLEKYAREIAALREQHKIRDLCAQANANTIEELLKLIVEQHAEIAALKQRLTRFDDYTEELVEENRKWQEDHARGSQDEAPETEQP